MKNKCKVITIANQKGGVGKTATSISLGVSLAKDNHKVLLIDFDPQGNLTKGLGYRDSNSYKYSINDALLNEVNDIEIIPEDYVIHTNENVDLIPSNILLSGVDMQLFSVMNRETVLKRVLEKFKDNYDYVLLECHYNTWCSIDEWRDELEHTDGLQKYLSYCQTNDINSTIMSIYSNNSINIMDMYKENNCGFDIIASTSIGNHTIVLGYNKRKDEYVTWRTSPNRKGGYDIGYYYSNYKNAFKNYEERCHDMLENHLSFEKNKTKAKEKSFER